ncbi:polyprenyl synthetase family protein [Metabacillus sp. Hm71]|uniref:polyprenyl synthetase family protein n=1 Tax=Metabacillus sp. Hm71 TaxID=3450743 RepID=UPI003F42913E
MIVDVDFQSIKQQMNQAIAINVKNPNLQNLLHSFVNEKKSFNFGHLALVHHKVFGGKDPEVLRMAAAIELLILSFDMFDDLEDLDNKLEPWMQIDPAIALNAATTLYTVSQHTFLTLSSPFQHQILHAVNKYAVQAMEGQHDDLQNSLNTEKECLEMMKLKSGSLIALASVSGMLLANAHYPVVEEYSYQIGIAAQADNDFRDLFHPMKNDRSLQKKSLPILYLQKGYNKHAHDLLTFFASGKEINEEFGDIKNYKQKLIDSGVAQYLNVIRQVSINRAIRMIEELKIDAKQIETLKTNIIKTNKTF